MSQIRKVGGGILQQCPLRKVRGPNAPFAFPGSAANVSLSSDANHILKSLHWLKVPDRIEYKVISVTYKLLQSSAPHYLRDLITIQSARSTRSSSLVTLLHPPVQSNLKITKRSFRHAALHLWNKLPSSLRIPSTGSIPSFSDSHHGPVCHLSYVAFHSRL